MIYISGEINEESFTTFHQELSQNKQKINITIISGGGCTYSALAYYDLIREQQSKGVIFNITLTGQAASAASLIFLACQNRYMTKNSYLMVHEDSHSDIDGKKTSDLKRYADAAHKLEQRWNKLVSECISLTLDKIEELHKNETYLSAEECSEMGIIKGIL